MPTTPFDLIEPPAPCEAPGELPPLTDAEAHYVIRRLARIDGELGALKANYEALRRDLEREREHVLAGDGARLREWTAAQLRGRRRSVRTLAGVAGFRTVPARLTVVDAGAVLAWARTAAPEALRETVDAGALGGPERFRQVDGETGEVGYAPPPGIEITPARETFYVKAGGAAESEGD